jgi:hypothetical protein
MELNLKKVRKLENKIQEYLNELDLSSSASVRSSSSFDEAKKAIEDKKSEFLKNFINRENLLKVRYQLRRQIEQKNEESGINSLMNLKVLTEKLIEQIDSIAKNDSFSDEELKDQLAAHSKLISEDVFRKTFVKTSFDVFTLNKIDHESLKIRKINYKKNLEEMEDNLSLLNVSTKIVLPEDILKILKEHKLL